MLAAAGPHGLTTVVEQMIKWQIFNLLSFNFVSLSTCESDPIDKVRSLYQPLSVYHVDKVTFWTMCG